MSCHVIQVSAAPPSLILPKSLSNPSACLSVCLVLSGFVLFCHVMQVSAASIIAKVTRDSTLSQWEWTESSIRATMNKEFGSGYPGDERW